MSDHLALTVIAVVMVIFLVLILVLTMLLWRALRAANRFLARAEQELNPLIFDLRLLMGDAKRISESAQHQLLRMEHTVKYLSSTMVDAADAVITPVNEVRIWSRALATGVRYFFRRQ